MRKSSRSISHSANNHFGQSVHHEFIREAIPEWLIQSSGKRVAELKQGVKVVPAWLKEASLVQHASLQRAMASGWRAQAAVDRMFTRLQDVYAFAQPLLNQALKDQYGVSVDVRETYIRPCITFQSMKVLAMAVDLSVNRMSVISLKFVT
jgi:hypothetical protein